MNKVRRVVITGASRGLGAAMAREFARLGHLVYGCARAPEGIERLRRDLPLPHRFRAVDVGDDAQVAAWANEVLADGPAPDLLLNNAAVVNACAPLWEVPPLEFAELLRTNVLGVFHVLRHFVPPMAARGRGVIVNFSSGWGRSVSPEVAPYCASKFAIEGMTRALAEELPPGMAAVPLNPGIIHTDMLDRCFAAQASEYPSPEEWVRGAVPFLLSLNASHNGLSLTVPQ